MLTIGPFEGDGELADSSDERCPAQAHGSHVTHSQKLTPFEPFLVVVECKTQHLTRWKTSCSHADTVISPTSNRSYPPTDPRCSPPPAMDGATPPSICVAGTDTSVRRAQLDRPLITGVLEYLLPSIRSEVLTVTNEAGSPPLHWAILNNHLGCIKALVAAGGAEVLHVRPRRGLGY